MVIMTGQGKGQTELIRRLRGQKNKTERKKEFALFTPSTLANFTDAFCLLGIVYCLCYFFPFFFSPCACLYQIWLKIFCMCLHCKPSYFSRDLVWWRSFFFFLPQGLDTSIFQLLTFEANGKCVPKIK